MNFLSKIWASLTGINLLGTATDPASPSSGDLWYNSTLGKFRKCQAGTISDLDEPISIGKPVTSGTNGSVLFVDGGNLAQDNTNLNWDNTNDGLAIADSLYSGTKLSVGGSVKFGSGAANLLWVDSWKSLVIQNTSNSSTSLQISKPNVGISDFASMVDNTTNGYLRFGSAGSSFTPAIKSSAGTSGNQTFYITQTTNDTTSSAAIRFDGRKASSKLASQPVLEVGSYTDTYMKVMADGSARFSTLDTSGTAPSPTGAIKPVIADSNGTLTTVDYLAFFTVDGTNDIGYKNVPQLLGNADATLSLGDAGKHVYHSASDTASRTYTIPANTSVAYPIGTVLTFINDNTNSVSIAINTDTLVLTDGSTGTRTLAQYGIATAIKVTTTRWIISGNNLT